MKKILFFLSILFLPCILLAGGKKKKVDPEEFNNKAIWGSSKFSPKGLNGLQMFSDNFSYSIADYDTAKKASVIVRYSFEKRTPLDTMFNSAYVQGLPKGFAMDNYKLSPSNNYVLIQANSKNLFRHSRSSQYYIYSAKKNKLKTIFNGAFVSDASFSPDESKIAFVYKNNLYIQYFRGDSIVQVTNDGIKNKVINGMADWVYEEEFALVHSYAWSPQGDKIAYYKFDESRVKEYQLPKYELDSIYPEQVKYKYPKAGEANSIVSIWVYQINNHSTQKMQVNEQNDQYIPRIKWTSSNSFLAVERLNRRQNYFELLAFNVNTGQPKTIYAEQSATYIDISDDLNFLKDNSFIIKSGKAGYKQLYHYDKTGNLIAKITQEQFDVVSLLGVDEARSMVYYSTNDPSPMLKFVYKIGIDGGNRKLLVENQKGTCTAVFSPDYKYFIFTTSRTLSPPVSRVYLTLGDSLYTLISNESLKSTIAEMGFRPKESLIIKLSDSIVLNGWMIRPPGFKERKKYPVLFFVYGGPGSNTVYDGWYDSYDVWFEYLASKGYIVVSIDNRGTGGRGEAFRKATYLKLGQLESDDQIAAARFLSSKYSFIDPERIGIFGWSYGGFMAAECLMKGNDVFKMAVAVAPVTDWRFYDNIYTERYMQKPSENPGGYKSTSVFEQLPKLKGKLLLVHGTFDDNVHPQNSFILMDRMVQMNKPFDSEFFTNKSHGISGGNTRLFLFNRITDYILDNL